ncbi:MAG: FAD-dependent oxidoreductase [Anaerolineales bacterium]|nr:FAD-dependent oxidoreductase [Anaerolineales bacterium]
MTDSPATTITLYGTNWCPDCHRSKQFLGDQRVPYTYIDIEKDPDAMAYVEKVNKGSRSIPTIVFADGDILVEPSNAELAAKLGLQTEASRSFYDVIVVGGGPAGLTAAFYMAREGIETLVIEKGGMGGQAGITNILDNFPGFDEGISGAEFAARLTRQAQRFNAETLQAQEVSRVHWQDGYWCVDTTSGQEYTTKAVLLATGAKYRRLEVPGENELLGKNIHFCATCDGAFYKGKKVLVIGGGNSAYEEGLFLTKFADQVDIAVRTAEPRASRILQEKVAGMAGVNVLLNQAVQGFKGDNELEAVLLEDRESGATSEQAYDGVFVFIGVSPNNELAQALTDTDAAGFVVTDKTFMTSAPGLFVAGDLRAGSTKQAATAAGEGAAAALMIRAYLQELG